MVELKKLLIDAGFKTELRGGYLLCNEQVKIILSIELVVFLFLKKFINLNLNLFFFLLFLLLLFQVLVRKVFDNNTGEPTLKIDGVLCENYFKIRKLLYSQFRIL